MNRFPVLNLSLSLKNSQLNDILPLTCQQALEDCSGCSCLIVPALARKGLKR